MRGRAEHVSTQTTSCRAHEAVRAATGDRVDGLQQPLCVLQSPFPPTIRTRSRRDVIAQVTLGFGQVMVKSLAKGSFLQLSRRDKDPSLVPRNVNSEEEEIDSAEPPEPTPSFITQANVRCISRMAANVCILHRCVLQSLA